MSNTVHVESFAQPLDPPVRGFLHRPETPIGDALILSHGAGSNAQAPLLVALAEVFSANGFTVLRVDLPYRQTRSYGPPGPGDAARDRAGLRNAIASIQKLCGGKISDEERMGDEDKRGAALFADVARSGNSGTQKSGRVYLGGHSYGGRQSSMLCAEEPTLVDGLLLLSYPLHPPRKPEQQRTQHLPDLRTPTLFIQGTRDPFATIPELERAIKMIPAKTKLVAIAGEGHDLGFKGKGKKEELPSLLLKEFADFFTQPLSS
jgi:predicted alpha/beta-hydrolase family hydrolase